MTLLEKAKEMGLPILYGIEAEGCPNFYGIRAKELDIRFCKGHTCAECYAREYIGPYELELKRPHLVDLPERREEAEPWE